MNNSLLLSVSLFTFPGTAVSAAVAAAASPTPTAPSSANYFSFFPLCSLAPLFFFFLVSICVFVLQLHFFGLISVLKCRDLKVVDREAGRFIDKGNFRVVLLIRVLAMMELQMKSSHLTTICRWRGSGVGEAAAAAETARESEVRER
ncbi:hypothetical protein HKD37_09G026784 [Glycine soja]